MNTLFERNLIESEMTVPILSRKVKTILRQYGYQYDKQNSKSPYSNSQYFHYWNINTKGEIRISDHAYPNSNHNFRGWDIDTRFWDDNWDDFIEDLKENEHTL